ncbi:MAG: UDP-N-acetylmuramate dehydrogenase [Oligoflexia bacterium]|nr:UDP-N-acetylmuramate dehydrogenase [Oligoflexia bacterium]
MDITDFKKSEILANHTSWLVGGPAEYYFEPTNKEELRDALIVARKESLNVTYLGGGSNVLVSDDGVSGLVISFKKMNKIEVIEDNEEVYSFWADAGVTKSELLKIFLKKKLEPALFLAGIPGQVGGGVVMNAGVSENIKPREFGEIIQGLEVLKPDGTIKGVKANRIKWSYRNCDGWQPGIITRALISWPNKPVDNILEKVKELNQARLAKQPLEYPSCGSVFVNPHPHKAGELIESVNLKGYKVGNAQISEKHANFIVNLGGATAQDIRELMQICIRKVKAVCGVELKTEVKFLGSR